MSLARLLRLARAPGGAALQARALPDRPEPALEARCDDDERRRVRHRLVRRRRHARASSTSIEPAWNDRNLRDLAGHISLAARVRPHPRLDRDGDPADELPSLPARPLAVDAQRGDPRVPTGQARAGVRGRPVALPRDRGVDRLRAVLLPRAHVRPRGRPAARRRARRRPDRGDGRRARRRAPDPDDRGDDRRRQHLGLPLLERGQLAVALLQHATSRRSAHQYPDNPVLHELSDETRLVVSEPLGDLAGAWNEVPESSCGVVQAGPGRAPPVRRRARRPDAGANRRTAALRAVTLAAGSTSAPSGGRREESAR